MQNDVGIGALRCKTIATTGVEELLEEEAVILDQGALSEQRTS